MQTSLLNHSLSLSESETDVWSEVKTEDLNLNFEVNWSARSRTQICFLIFNLKK